MRIAVTAAQPQLDAAVDPRFGRCPCFVIVETDDLSSRAIDNENVALGQGAGIQSARLLAEHGVRYVLTGNCGPNAHQTLTAAGIGVIIGCAGTVRDAVQQFTAGRLRPIDGPIVPGHSGLGAGAGPAQGPAPWPAGGAGPGRGMGRGRRRGMGRGRRGGMGRGRGRGGGGGMGGGRGQGGGGGSGRGRGPGGTG